MKSLNYLRKIITHNISPSDIGTYMDSLNKCINVYEFLHGLVSSENTIQQNIQQNTKQHARI